jgi:hypothetical protein
MKRLLPLLLCIVGCSPADGVVIGSDSLVMSSLLFSRQNDGVSDGFDLDGVTSEQGGDSGCGHGDFVGVDGAEGIDNAGARLIVLLEQTEAVATESLIQQQINNGEVMILLTFEGLDDRLNDDSVDVILERAWGTPMVGNDGWIEPGQTLERSPEVAPIRVEDVPLVDGVLELSGLDVLFPFTIFDYSIDLTIADVSLRVRLDPTSGGEGVFGGRIDPQEILDVAIGSNIDQALQDSLPDLFYTLSDLRDDNGDCRILSGTFLFDTRQVYLFEDGE